jgi:hypothetical protein
MKGRVTSDDEASSKAAPAAAPPEGEPAASPPVSVEPAPRAESAADTLADAPAQAPSRAEAPHAVPGPARPTKPSFKARVRAQLQIWFSYLVVYFAVDRPTVSAGILPFSLLSIVLYTRHPTETNFIFDEQEALLANPYVRSVMDAKPKLHWLDAFKTDFWGRAPEVTIGSYRPLPNLVWRAVWWVTCSLKRISPNRAADSPFLCHWVNVLLHGVNGALIMGLAYAFTRRRDIAWITGAVFTASAVITEAVSGVVGLSDVLGGMGALFALYALTLPGYFMPLGVFLGVTIGLYSKESALCCVGLVPLAALLLSQVTHPHRPRRWARALGSFVAAAAAFVLYVEVRKRLFHTPTPLEYQAETVAGKGTGTRAFAAILRWYAQPGLPKDALNNPLVHADTPHRIAGALRVYARGWGQVLFPQRLSGDYSSPQEPIPDRLIFPESVVGALAMIVPLLLVPVLGIRAYLRRRRLNPTGAIERFPDLSPLVAFAGAWVALSYFPVSNIPILLPTVRAERFWYFPVIGTALLIGIALPWVLRFIGRVGRSPERQVADGDRYDVRTLVAGVLVGVFFAVQVFAARRHANDYFDDLAFWEATSRAVPRSSKAHLNYSVMLGARGRMEERLVANGKALELEPKWAMANVYLGDTLCRMHRASEAVPHYLKGFEYGPNDVSLIALALQCLWDEKELTQDNELMTTLESKSAEFPGSWYKYLVDDVKSNGETNNGVDPKHRPRGYNEGPKD